VDINESAIFQVVQPEQFNFGLEITASVIIGLQDPDIPPDII